MVQRDEQALKQDESARHRADRRMTGLPIRRKDV
jgi:hypothetical protein